DHFLFLEFGKGGVQTLEAIKVVEHRLDRLVHRFLGYLGRGHHGGAYTEGFHVAVVTPVHAAGDDGLGIIGMLGNDTVDFLAIDRHYHRINGVVASWIEPFGWPAT